MHVFSQVSMEVFLQAALLVSFTSLFYMSLLQVFFTGLFDRSLLQVSFAASFSSCGDEITSDLIKMKSK